MSHFSVLVATKSPEDLDAALAPFHEFECTGLDDQYVVDVDETEEARETYARYTVTRLRDADGNLHDPYDDKFYREPTQEEIAKHSPMLGTSSAGYTSKDWGDGKGYRAKFRFVPEGWQEIEVPAKDVEGVAEFVESYYGYKAVPHGKTPDLRESHKFGYVLLDEAGGMAKVVRRTNPNQQWDWWVIGGRYPDRLLLKDGTRTSQGVKAMLDLEGMRAAAIEKRRSSWNECRQNAVNAGLSLTSDELDDIRRQFYRRKAEEVTAWCADRTVNRQEHYKTFMGDMAQYDKIFEEFYPRSCDRDVPIQDWIAAAPALTSFAVLKDGKWYERGSMGWWGIVSDEKDEETWEREFSTMLAGLPDDTCITIVDCHI